MEDITRKRILRMLDRLPEEQLYQVLDYMEFLDAKYAREATRKPDAFQQFAERVEDQMRFRSVAPRAMKGTMRVMSTASRLLDGVRDLGRDLVTPSSAESGRSAVATDGGNGTDGAVRSARSEATGPGDDRDRMEAE